MVESPTSRRTMNDICIVGGGIIGLSLARELAGRGFRVRVLARERGARPAHTVRGHLETRGPVRERRDEAQRHAESDETAAQPHSHSIVAGGLLVTS